MKWLWVLLLSVFISGCDMIGCENINNNVIDGTIDFLSASCDIDYSKEIIITSVGGSGYDALEIANKIIENDTPVVIVGYCISSCVVIAAASNQLHYDKDVVFGVHSSNFDKLTDDIVSFLNSIGYEKISNIILNTPNDEVFNFGYGYARHLGL